MLITKSWRFVLGVGAILAVTAHADPIVEGFDLVSSVRSGRTTTDYIYRLRVRGDQKSYTDASIVVSSTAAATQIIDGSVVLGNVDAGTFFRSDKTFTIRQDRLVAFDPTTLTFAFSGQPTGVGVGADAPRIGHLEFLEDGGRPQHLSSVPIQGNAPPGGTPLMMRVDIHGSVASARYRFRNAANLVLADGPMVRAQPETSVSARFLAGVVTPLEPYFVEIEALGTDSQTVEWRSATAYQPQFLALEIMPARGILNRGQTIAVTLRISPTTATGFHTLSLSLPAALSGAIGPWSVDLLPGRAIEVSTQVTASALPETFGPFTISAECVSAADPSKKATASLRLFVE